MAIVFIPTLLALLVSKEQENGHELTQKEVEAVRDNATAIQLPENIAGEMAISRGYQDINPDDVWSEWLAYKRNNTP